MGRLQETERQRDAGASKCKVQHVRHVSKCKNCYSTYWQGSRLVLHWDCSTIYHLSFPIRHLSQSLYYSLCSSGAGAGAAVGLNTANCGRGGLRCAVEPPRRAPPYIPERAGGAIMAASGSFFINM